MASSLYSSVDAMFRAVEKQNKRDAFDLLRNDFTRPQVPPDVRMHRIESKIKGKIQQIVSAIKALDSDALETFRAPCPYPRCTGIVKIRADSEFHCNKCGSEIASEYVCVEYVKRTVLRMLQGNE